MDSSLTRYRELLAWAYEGEVAGEALLRTVHRQGTFAERSDELDQLVELESVTAALLLPLLKREELMPRADGAWDGLTPHDENGLGTWNDFLVWTRAIATEALPRFQELVDVAPPGATEVAVLVREHEEVLLEFADRALRSDDEATVCIADFVAKVRLGTAGQRSR